MSRCHTYPPPGYQKKAPPADLSIPSKVPAKNAKENAKENAKKKEKEKKVKEVEEKEKQSKDTSHKEKRVKTAEKDKEKNKDKRDKDKKEKRRKDGEANGLAHDKDPRTSKLQRTSHAKDMLHSGEENGRVYEVTTSAVVACPLDRDVRDPAKPCGNIGLASHSPSMYIKKEQPANGKVDTTMLPLGLSKPPVGGLIEKEATPSSRPNNHNHHIDSSTLGSQRHQKSPVFSICDSLREPATFSTLDDAEWLFPARDGTRQKPKAKAEVDTSLEVWAEAIHLPSADMYALPYVVPY